MRTGPDIWLILLYAMIIVACICTVLARKKSEWLWWALASICTVLVLEHLLPILR